MIGRLRTASVTRAAITPPYATSTTVGCICSIARRSLAGRPKYARGPRPARSRWRTSTSTPSARRLRTCCSTKTPLAGFDRLGYMFVTTRTRSELAVAGQHVLVDALEASHHRLEGVLLLDDLARLLAGPRAELGVVGETSNGAGKRGVVPDRHGDPRPVAEDHRHRAHGGRDHRGACDKRLE